MNFKTTKIKIEKRTFNYGDADYNLYLIPEKSAGEKLISFYINKEGYGPMTFVFGVKESSTEDIDELIKENLEDFIKAAELDLDED